MPSDHIVRSFDEELTALHQAIIDIGELSHSQLKAAVEALASHDTARAAAVVKGDSEVDQLERELDARAVRVLALRQPMARDLRQVLSALRIGTEFERISDFAANIAKRSLALGNAGPPELIGDIQSLAGLAAGFLAQVVEAYRTRNAQLAMTVWAQDERLDEAYTLSYHRIVFWMQEAPARVAAGTHLCSSRRTSSASATTPPTSPSGSTSRCLASGCRSRVPRAIPPVPSASPRRVDRGQVALGCRG
jgi:phosphate transport system protein